MLAIGPAVPSRHRQSPRLRALQNIICKRYAIMIAPSPRVIYLSMLIIGLAVGRYSAPAADDSLAAPHPFSPSELVADRLYFGRAIPGGGSVSDAAWTKFLEEVVTPRFPEGL